MSQATSTLLLLSLLACATFSPPSPAQGSPVLVRDIDAQLPDNSLLRAPGPAVPMGGFSYFAADHADVGRELWRTDGTAAGTTLVRDIFAGSPSSDPSDLAVLNGVLYFRATSPLRGAELWRSDGTAAGTWIVRDIEPGSASSYPAGLTAIGGYVYFHAAQASTGRELWRTDGTNAGTVLLVDLRPGGPGSMTSNAEVALGYRLVAGIPSSLVLFVADDGTSGQELWQWSSAGASLRADIAPGSASSSPQGLTSFGGYVMFSATEATGGREPYVTRYSGATRAADINPGLLGSTPADFAGIVQGGATRFYFSALRIAYGRELWMYDATAGAATLVADLWPGSTGSDPVPFALGSEMLLSAADGIRGRELWKTDGTAAGTVLVRDIARAGGSSPERFGRFGGSPARAFFFADDGTGREPWVTDGTTAGTVRIADLATSTGGSAGWYRGTLGDGRVLFEANTPLPAAWVTDGTTAGTAFLRPPVAGELGSRPELQAGFASGQRVLLWADDGLAGFEPWRSDATPAGTVLAADVRVGGVSSAPRDGATLGNVTVFSADDGVVGREPWVSDGTAAGTFLLRDIAPGAATSDPRGFLAVGNFVFFLAYDPVNGGELWRTDGTVAGTALVADIAPGSAGSMQLFRAAPLGTSRAVFVATTPAAGYEPWVTDGTAAGTFLLKDIMPGSASSVVLGEAGARLASAGAFVYFIADDGVRGTELWKTDGTPVGTVLVHDLTLGSGSTTFGEMVGVGPWCYFVASSASAPDGLWLSLGTSVGTALAHPFSSPSSPYGAVNLTPFNGGVLFHAYEPTTGWEPWFSTGAVAQTVRLADTLPGQDPGCPMQAPFVYELPAGWFAVVPGAQFALFPAVTPWGGIELWRTAGTPASTMLHAEIAPGAWSSDPGRPVLVGGALLCAASDGVHGRELFAVEPVAAAFRFGHGCPGTGGRTPRMDTAGAPSVGNRAFELLVRDGRANAPAVAFLGFAPAQIPVGGGCTFWFDLFGPYVTLPGGTDTAGTARMSLPIPPDPSLSGLLAWTQGTVVDPAGAFLGLVAATDALRLVLAPQ